MREGKGREAEVMGEGKGRGGEVMQGGGSRSRGNVERAVE